MSQPTNSNAPEFESSQQTPEEKIQQLTAELERVREEQTAEKERHKAILLQTERQRRRWLLLASTFLVLLVVGAACAALWYQTERNAEIAARQKRQALREQQI